MTKVCRVEAWDLAELFEVADVQGKGSVSIYDLERLIIEHKKCGSRTLIDDIELIMQMYDRNGGHKISYSDFQEQLTPKIN